MKPKPRKFLQRLLALLIAIPALSFAYPSMAKDIEQTDITASIEHHNAAQKDSGQAIVSSVLNGCSLKIINPNVYLYLNRGLQNTRLAKVPPGTYQPLDYMPGWYKIRAKGWIAWIQDSTATVTKVNNCQDKLVEKHY